MKSGNSTLWNVAPRLDNKTTSGKKASNQNTYKYVDFNKLKLISSITNWNEIKLAKTVEDKISLLTSLFQNNIKICTSIRQKNKNQLKHWITTGIIQSIKKRDKLHTLTRQQPFNTTLINSYKKYRNKLSDIIAKQKQNYYREAISKNSKNIKKLWSTVKDITTHTEHKTTNYNINIKNKIHDSNLDATLIANTFNSYFISMGNPNNVNSNKKQYHSVNNNSTQSPYLRMTTKKEINYTINNMKGDSAPGKDGITINIIKHIKESISDILEHIFNTILEECNIPNSFKIALITHIHKGGDKSDIRY